MTSYLVILGGNALALPAVKHLVSLGFKIIVIDKDPTAPCQNVAHIFLNVDFSKFTDTAAALTDYKVKGVLALNDFGVRTASRLVSLYNLPGYDTDVAIRVTNKVRMKTCWHEAELLTPDFIWFSKKNFLHKKENIDNQWNKYPCIIKPAHSGGGSRGVHLVHSAEEIYSVLKNETFSNIDDEVILEEYIQGTEHTIEVIIYKGTPYILSISDKKNYPESVSIVQQLLFPGPIGNKHKAAITRLIALACKALNLSDGCAHFEVLIKKDLIYLLEVGGRPGGGLNFYPICNYSTGYDYPLLLAQVLTGGEILFTKTEKTKCLGWYYFDIKPGILEKISGYEKILSHPNMIHYQINLKKGDKITPLYNDLMRPGYFLIHGNNFQEVQTIINDLKNVLKFEISPE